MYRRISLRKLLQSGAECIEEFHYVSCYRVVQFHVTLELRLQQFKIRRQRTLTFLVVPFVTRLQREIAKLCLLVLLFLPVLARM